MKVLLLAGLALTGLAVFLLCSVLLQRQQQRVQRKSVKSRFIDSPQKNARQVPFSTVPILRDLIKKSEQKKAAHYIDAELPRMFDLLVMGMNAGLGFDTAFSLYVTRFDTALAEHCRESFDLWERGLISRSEGLERIATKLGNPVFNQFSRTAIRSLRHGIPMTPLIKEYAEQARKEYRSKQKEKVAKAPVKMLLPTGVLILPAMMMLVIGPILLDVTERMV